MQPVRHIVIKELFFYRISHNYFFHALHIIWAAFTIFLWWWEQIAMEVNIQGKKSQMLERQV